MTINRHGKHVADKIVIYEYPQLFGKTCNWDQKYWSLGWKNYNVVAYTVRDLIVGKKSLNHGLNGQNA